MPHSATLSNPSSLSTLDEDVQDPRSPYGRMLTIRQDQVDAFERYQLRKFEDEIVEHLKEFAPRHWNMIGERIGREAIRFGIKQAEKYGFTNRGPVRFYIEMMFLFGSFFDTDPQYPWIAEVLNDLEHQMIRADRLYDRLKDYWARVAGFENSFTLTALNKLSQARVEDYVADPSEPLCGCFLAALRDIYPQKCEYMGEVPLRALLGRTFELADRHGFKSSEEFFLLTVLTFFFGHQCAHDPLQIQIRKMYADTKRSEIAERCLELRRKATQHLRYILNGDEGVA